MSNQFKVNDKEFQAAASQLFQTSSRSMREFINGQLLGLSAQALKQTKIGDKTKIERALGRLLTENQAGKYYGAKQRPDGYFRVKKSDWQRMEGSLAAKIVNSRLVKSGGRPIWGKRLADAANKLIGQKLRSVSFIKSGWIQAIKTMSSVVKEKRTGGNDGARSFGKPKGYAIPAPFSLSGQIQGEIANGALVSGGKFSSGPSDPKPIARVALESAMKIQAKDMEQEFVKRITGECKKVSAQK